MDCHQIDEIQWFGHFRVIGENMGVSNVKVMEILKVPYRVDKLANQKHQYFPQPWNYGF